MPIRVKIYVAVIAALGLAAVIVDGILPWHTRSWAGFLIYLGATVLASGFKIRLPGVTGTLSAAFFPVLIGIVSLGVPEALIAACAAVLIQCVWNSKSRKLVKVVFNVASVSIAVASAAAMFYSQWLQNLHCEFAVRLAILGSVYFVANTLPIAGIISLTEKKSTAAVWRGLFWSLPHYLVGAATAGLFELTKDHLGWQTAMLFIPVTCLIYRSSSLHIARINDARIHAEETAALHLRTITSLALAIEAKDQETHFHLQRVQSYAMEIGKELGLTGNELEALRAASLLHDIGKIAVPDYIISKPGKLTPYEFQRMKIHPVVGAEILERVRFPFAVAPIVRCHHEKWDGSGYPAGLKGEEIPIGARILAAVDCLDALASDRHYRRALPLDEAMAVVESDSGKAFDPRVIKCLKARYVELEQQARSTPIDPWHLSTDIQIIRGAAPGAGFAESGTVLRPGQPKVSEGGVTSGEVSDLVRLKGLLEAVNSGERFLSFDETMSIVLSRLLKIVPFDSLAIYVPQGSFLLPAYTAGKHRVALSEAAIPVGQGVSGWAIEANRPTLNGNPAVELCFSTIPCDPPAPVSALAIPLPGQTMPAAVLTLYAAAENAFHSADLQMLARISGDLGCYLEKNLRDHLATGIHPAETAPTAEYASAPSAGTVKSVLVH